MVALLGRANVELPLSRPRQVKRPIDGSSRIGPSWSANPFEVRELPGLVEQWLGVEERFGHGAPRLWRALC